MIGRFGMSLQQVVARAQAGATPVAPIPVAAGALESKVLGVYLTDANGNTVLYAKGAPGGPYAAAMAVASGACVPQMDASGLPVPAGTMSDGAIVDNCGRVIQQPPPANLDPTQVAQAAAYNSAIAPMGLSQTVPVPNSPPPGYGGLDIGTILGFAAVGAAAGGGIGYWRSKSGRSAGGWALLGAIVAGGIGYFAEAV